MQLLKKATKKKNHKQQLLPPPPSAFPLGVFGCEQLRGEQLRGEPRAERGHYPACGRDRRNPPRRSSIEGPPVCGLMVIPVVRPWHDPDGQLLA